ncbi:hypothetical protein ACN26Z_18785 [Verrucosispora sp. WMMD703]|uniref:Uncharacterized protein n=1 Tax=Micromonospora sediminimaris TaxID=547162 RepID=A0A9W5XJ99_9ACTN|nr:MULTISPECIES: hypothetical protein [Micromonospora]WFE48144.1 hypothetical protein O7624_29215 [Verrucosispora sp. WMMD1129]GIJ32657.1 hypothetical protein Vse01_18050 [Micromonospora sediminimaris]
MRWRDVTQSSECALGAQGMNKGDVVSAGDLPGCPPNVTLSSFQLEKNPTRIEQPASVARFVDEVDNNG